MYKILLPVLILVSSCNQRESFKKPPPAPQEMAVDTYFGQEIQDPYRNLENLEDSTVVHWLKQQDSFATDMLSNISKRNELLKKLQSFNKEAPYKITRGITTEDGQYFYVKQYPDEKFGKLYHRKSYEDKEETLLYDPAEYKPDSGVSYLISYLRHSWDSSKIVIALSKEGVEVSELVIMDLSTKTLLPQVITNCNPASYRGVEWLPDNSGFIYQHLPTIDVKDVNFSLNTVSVLYKLGEDPKNIRELFSRKTHPELQIKSEDFPIISYKSENDNYIFGSISGATTYEDTYYASIDEINTPKINWKPLFKKTDKVRQFRLEGNSLIFLSAKGASNFQICKTSILNPDFDAPEILVQENVDRTLLDFEYREEGLFYTTLKNGIASQLFVLKDGKEAEIKLPMASGKSYINSLGDAFYVSLQGWTTPSVLYKYDIAKNIYTDVTLVPHPDYPEFKDIIVEEVEVASHDGTMVPLSIIYKKGLKHNGKNHTILLGYGAYGSSFSPFFSTDFLTWVAEGGIWAIPHVRGGGEKGDAWYKAGYKTTKPNTWKDAIACTEYMIKEGYTSPDHTIIYSISAGGIMVGRAITERPDLYAVAIGRVPSINTMRLEFQVNGANSAKEFGTLKDSIEFKALLEMDAYHHIKEGENYPATLITAGIKDNRVTAWSPAKFVARFQAANASKKPILLKVGFDAGHGLNNSDEKHYNEMADIFAFAFWQTGHPEYQLE